MGFGLASWWGIVTLRWNLSNFLRFRMDLGWFVPFAVWASQSFDNFTLSTELNLFAIPAISPLSAWTWFQVRGYQDTVTLSRMLQELEVRRLEIAAHRLRRKLRWIRSFMPFGEVSAIYPTAHPTAEECQPILQAASLQADLRNRKSNSRPQYYHFILHSQIRDFSKPSCCYRFHRLCPHGNNKFERDLRHRLS